MHFIYIFRLPSEFARAIFAHDQMNQNAYPLSWPQNWPRNSGFRESGAFDGTFDAVRRQLGLTTDATEDQVLSRYRSLAPGSHPDTGGSADDFRALCEAKDLAISTIRNRK